MADDVVFILANKRSNLQLDRTLLLPDCTVSIEHKFENDVTEHPIDGSANVSDHIVLKNNTIRVSGIYNQHTLSRYVNDGVSYDDRINDAYKKILDLRNSKSRFQVVSRYDVYNDCVVRSLTIPITPDNGNALVFDMEIVQVRVSDTISTVNFVQIEDVSESMLDNAAFKKTAGTKQKERTSSSPAVNQADRVVNGGG